MGWLRSGNRHQRGDGRAAKGAGRGHGTRTRSMVGAGRGWDPFVWVRTVTNIPHMQEGCPPRDTGAPHD